RRADLDHRHPPVVRPGKDADRRWSGAGYRGDVHLHLPVLLRARRDPASRLRRRARRGRQCCGRRGLRGVPPLDSEGRAMSITTWARRLRTVLLWVFLLGLAGVMVTPLVFGLLASVMPLDQVLASDPGLVPNSWEFSTYVDAWT